MPSGSRVDGKQVYSLGSVLLYFDPDKNVVFAKLGGEGFRPASLKQLLIDAAAPS